MAMNSETNMDSAEWINNVPVPIFGMDLDGNINAWNDSISEVLGYSAPEVLNKPFSHVADQTVFTDTIESTSFTKRSSFRYTDSGVETDDTASATGSESSIVSSNGCPIESFEESKSTMSDFIDDPWPSPDPLSSAEMHRKKTKALRWISSPKHRLQFRTKSNESRSLMIYASPRVDALGNIVGVLGVALDATESLKKLTKEVDDLRQLEERTNSIRFGTDLNGDINDWNYNATMATGFTVSTVLGKSLVNEYLRDSTRAYFQIVLKKAINDGIETSKHVLECRSKSGDMVYLLVNVEPSISAAHSIIGCTITGQDVTESIKKEREMSAMARELRQLVDTANAPIFGIDKLGNVNEWNNKTAEITGFTKEEALGKTLVESFIAPSHRDSVRIVLQQALREIETSNYELEFQTKSGEIRHLLVNATTRRDAENNIVGVVGVAQDVTDETKHDRAVAAMATGLRQLIETANAPIFGIDVHGNVNEWNNKTAEITGYSKEEARNKPLVLTFIEKSLQSSVKEVLDNALQGKETSNYKLLLHTKFNEIRYLLVNATTRRDEKGIIVGVVGVAQDVTESAEHDREMESMANELRQLIETANAPIFGIDVEGKINEWNDKTAEITGFSKEEAISMPIVETFIVEASRESVKGVLDKALHGTETSNYEIQFKTKNNEIRYLLVNATTRRDVKNTIIGVVGVAQDVTEAAKHDRAVAAMANELRQLVDTANAPIFGIDMVGNVNEWNNKTSEITGFSYDEAFTKPLVGTFIVPSLRKSVQEVLDNALKGQGTSNYELEFRTKSNEIRYLLVNATTRRDAESNIVGVVGVAQDVTEAVQRDRAVSGMANELRQLVDTANAPIFGIDIHGHVNEWNVKTAEITGYSHDEALNRPLVATYIVPKLRQSVQEVLDQALRGIETSNYELEFKTKTNEIRYLLVNATTRRDAENNIVGVVGVAQDVTEAAKHDRAVAAMANELRQLVDTANAPIFGIDIHGNVNEWNDKTAEITGYTKAEAMNCPLVNTYIVPLLRPSVQEVLDNALKGQGTSNYELEFRTKTHEIRYLLVNATTRRDAENNIVGVVGVAQDVTEAAERDRAVAAMANELRQLVDTANAPIFGIDVHGNVNEWNDKTAEITGYSKREAHEKPLVSTFIVPSLRKSVQEVLDKALHGNETSNYELEFETKSGEIRYLLVNATTRRDPENRIVGVVGVAQDVTDDRKHAEELRNMQYLQVSQEASVETERNMTAYFAHELRNPLHAIDSALISMPECLPAEAQSLVNAMQLCTGFMSSIMNNLLDVRKMEERKMILKSTPISLHELMKSVHKMLEPSVRPSVVFDFECLCEDRNWVLGDSHRMQQVLTNVVTNAIKYTTTGSIKLRIQWQMNNVLRFECIDTGPGIPKNDQAKLFQRFVQRGGAPGTGLGLAISKHLVDLIGGSIRFDSDPTVKAGTTCIVILPLPPCVPPSLDIVAKEIHMGIIEEELKFLIIDDIKMNRMMLKRRIKKGIASNALIMEAATGEEALEICKKHTFDVIVVDQYMEEAGGILVGTDVVYAMRRSKINSIIIGCSGNDIDQLFADAGTDWVWKKPIPSNSEILTKLHQALRERKICPHATTDA